MEFRTKRIIWLLAGLLIFGILYTLKNTSYFVRAAGFTTFVILFFLIDSLFKIRFKSFHYFLVIFIATFTVLFSPLYRTSAVYDKVLHLIVPVFISYLIFVAIDKLVESENKNRAFFTKLLLTFSIMVTLVTLHEIGEYLLDQLFDWKLQGVYLKDYSSVSSLKIVMESNDDTMIDSMLSTGGALIFAIGKTISYHYDKIKIKNKNKTRK